MDGRDDLHRGRMREDARDGRALELAFQLGRYVVEPVKRKIDLHQPITPAKTKPSQPSHAPFDTRDRIPIHDPAFDDPEPIRTVRSDDAPAVGEHQHAADLEHRPELVEKAAVGLRRDDHAEAWCAHLQTAPQHQSVSNKDPLSSRFLVRQQDLYLGSKMGRLVGRPGKESWDTKMGVSSRGSRSSRLMISIRSLRASGYNLKTIERQRSKSTRIKQGRDGGGRRGTHSS